MHSKSSDNVMRNKEQNESIDIIHGTVYNIYDESKAGMGMQRNLIACNS